MSEVLLADVLLELKSFWKGRVITDAPLFRERNDTIVNKLVHSFCYDNYCDKVEYKL